MNTSTRSNNGSRARHGIATYALMAVLYVAHLASVMAAPAQLPLLGRVANPAAPNVVYTIDDSGSMAWRYMPDSIIPASLADDDRWWISFHPQDIRSIHTSYDDLKPNSLRLLSTREDDLVSARLRSPAVNTIYYNPEVRYQPWFKSDGSQFGAASSTSATLNPNQPLWGTVNLEGTISYTGPLCRSTALNALTVNCNNVNNEQIVPATYYQYNGGSVNAVSSFTRIQIKDFTTFNRGESRTDCVPSGTGRTCTRAQEYQNFANWFVYNRTRVYLAIAATSQAFSAQGDGLRVGYARIGKTSNTKVDEVNTKSLERGVRVFSGADRVSFFNWLYDAPATSSTHLRRAMDDVGDYYTRTDNRGPWGNTPGSNDPTPHLACRKSYNILMTDGYWNSEPAKGPAARMNVDNTPGPVINNPAGGSYQYTPSRPFADNASNTLADVAMYYWNRDLRPDLDNKVKTDPQNPAFWQHMVNFTVGLGVNGTLNFPEDLADLQSGAKRWADSVPGDTPTAIDDLWHAAINSRGRYLSATDPVTFSRELAKVLDEIASRNGSEAGVAVANTVLQVGNRKYLPSYVTDQWTGDIKAVGIDVAGQPLDTIWSAAAKMPADTARNIFAGNRSATSPRAVPFEWDSLSTDMKAELGAGANAALVNYLRGNSALEGITYRKRVARLGDIVNSEPTYIAGLVNMRYHLLPTSMPAASSYAAFLATKRARAGIVLVGANDGMLHAFRDSDGVETFAFIPRSLLPTLGLLAAPSYGHRYYVDGPLTESDAYWGGSWRNVVVGSTGAGSRAIFGLDVTNTAALNADSVLWELDHTQQPELGHVLAPVEIGLMKNGQWAAVFGNGYSSLSGKAQLFIVNLQTGALIKRIDTLVGNDNGLGGARVIRDGNQVIVGAYAGDLKGNIWKFDLSSADAGNWRVGFSGAPLFNAKDSGGVAQPITAAPATIAHPRGGNIVLVGTGKLFEEGDQSSTTRQSLYGLWDQQSLVQTGGVWNWSNEGPITSAASVKPRSINTTTTAGANGETYYTTATPTSLDWTTDRGWSLPLTILPGHRNTLPPRLLLGLALFETIAPLAGSVISDPCTGSNGQGFSFLLNPLTGSMSSTPLFDTNNDGKVDESDKTVGGQATGQWRGNSSWLSGATATVPKDCTANPASCLCPVGTKEMRGINATAGSMAVCFAVPPPTRWWWRQLMVQ